MNNNSITINSTPFASNYFSDDSICSNKINADFNIKYYKINNNIKVCVSNWANKVIWISNCKFCVVLDNKGNYNIETMSENWSHLEFHSLIDAKNHLNRLTKTYKELQTLIKKLNINTMFEESNE